MESNPLRLKNNLLCYVLSLRFWLFAGVAAFAAETKFKLSYTDENAEAGAAPRVRHHMLGVQGCIAFTLHKKRLALFTVILKLTAFNSTPFFHNAGIRQINKRSTALALNLFIWHV